MRIASPAIPVRGLRVTRDGRWLIRIRKRDRKREGTPRPVEEQAAELLCVPTEFLRDWTESFRSQRSDLMSERTPGGFWDARIWWAPTTREWASRVRRSRRSGPTQRCLDCWADIPTPEFIDHRSTVHDHGKRRPLHLVSRRGKRFEGLSRCDECLRLHPEIWKYKQSSRGEVGLCGRCKGIVLDRSFGRVDAMSRALTGGGFETNRRRH